MISMCILQSKFVYYDLYVHTKISMPHLSLFPLYLCKYFWLFIQMSFLKISGFCRLNFGCMKETTCSSGGGIEAIKLIQLKHYFRPIHTLYLLLRIRSVLQLKSKKKFLFLQRLATYCRLQKIRSAVWPSIKMFTFLDWGHVGQFHDNYTGNEACHNGLQGYIS